LLTTSTLFEEDTPMLWAIALVLLVLWALGFFAFHVASGLIHLLLVIAVIVFVVHLVQGRRSL
jgi:Family of unknown function (DUF5670)